jgi:hypothetical protein
MGCATRRVHGVHRRSRGHAQACCS